MSDKYPEHKLEDNTIYHYYVDGEAMPTASVWDCDGYIAYYDWVYNVAGSSLWDATGKITWEEFAANQIENERHMPDLVTPVINIQVEDIEFEPDAPGLSVSSIRAAALAWLLEYAINEYQDAEKVQRVVDFLAVEATP